MMSAKNAKSKKREEALLKKNPYMQYTSWLALP